MSKAEIKKRVKDWDTKTWREELNNKSSLNIYRTWKKDIKGEEIYDNSLEILSNNNFFDDLAEFSRFLDVY